MRDRVCEKCGAPIDPEKGICQYCDTSYQIAYSEPIRSTGRYIPSPEQQERCKKCWYWRLLDGDWQYCCHYILAEGHMRGGDPCKHFKPGKFRRPKKGRGADITLNGSKKPSGK